MLDVRRTLVYYLDSAKEFWHSPTLYSSYANNKKRGRLYLHRHYPNGLSSVYKRPTLWLASRFLRIISHSTRAKVASMACLKPVVPKLWGMLSRRA